MLKHLPLIFKNTLRNKRRSILTILSIAASLCLLGFLLAIYNMFYFEAAGADHAYRLIVRNRVSLANPLARSYEARIAQVPGVAEVSIFQWYGGVYKDNNDPANMFGRFAVEPAKFLRIRPDYNLTPEEYKAFTTERSSCIVGNKLAARHGFKIGQRVTLVGDIFPVTLNLIIRGIYTSERDNENMIFNYDYLNESLTGGMKDTVGAYFIRMANPDDATRISQQIDSMFRNSPLQTKTETERAFELSFLSFLGNVKAFLFSICAAITFTVLLVSGNTMAMTVRERVKEVGILKTLGFTNGKILSLLLGESIFISVLGGLVGLGLTVLLCAWLRTTPSLMADMTRLTTPPWVLSASMAIAIGIGLISSFFPALSASRRPIIEAMRVTD